jgi:hypothetical protein
LAGIEHKLDERARFARLPEMKLGCEVTKSVFQKLLSDSDITMSELQIPLSKVGFASKTAKMPFFLPERLASVQK